MLFRSPGVSVTRYRPLPCGPLSRGRGRRLFSEGGKKISTFFVQKAKKELCAPGKSCIIVCEARNSASRSGALPTPRPLSTENTAPYTTAFSRDLQPLLYRLAPGNARQRIQAGKIVCVLYLSAARVYGFFSVPPRCFCVLRKEQRRGPVNHLYLPLSRSTIFLQMVFSPPSGLRPPRRRKTKF